MCLQLIQNTYLSRALLPGLQVLHVVVDLVNHLKVRFQLKKTVFKIRTLNNVSVKLQNKKDHVSVFTFC